MRRFLHFFCSVLSCMVAPRAFAAPHVEVAECAPGLIRCPDPGGCVDTATDEENCGSCFSQCEKDAECLHGACLPIGDVAPVVKDDFDISAGADALANANVNQDIQVLPQNTLNCINANEPYGVRSPTTNELFMGLQRSGASSVGNGNWATSHNTWQNFFTTPNTPAGWAVVGDPWATAGSYSGLVYLGFLMMNQSAAQCVATVSATPANFKIGNFVAYPYRLS